MSACSNRLVAVSTSASGSSPGAVSIAHTVPPTRAASATSRTALFAPNRCAPSSTFGNTLSGSVTARFASMSNRNGSTSPAPSFSLRSIPGATNGTTAHPTSSAAVPAAQNSARHAATTRFRAPVSPVAAYRATNRTRHAAMPRSNRVKYASTPSATHHAPYLAAPRVRTR